ncbi:MAG: insulinase family protein, partial [Chloroflexi bacterium]|nr:insulinase family protein [Chloroflexota bacterium]
PEDQIEKLRALVLTGLAMRSQSTGEQAAMAFDNIVYHGHPYSRPDEGYPETVREFTKESMTNFHADHYGPKGMRIAIVGGIDPDEAVDIVKSFFGDWQNPSQKEVPQLPPWQPLGESKSVRKEILGKSQSDLIVGTAGPKRSSPDFLPAALGNSILGQFGMMGRVGEIVREQAGLAYYANSSLSSSIGPGPWSVSAGVNPKNEDQAVELIKKELTRFGSELVDEEELEDNQANFIGRTPLSLESNIGVAASLLHIEKHQLGLDYYIRYPERIRAITREDILIAAQKYLDPEKMVTAIAGPPLQE